MVMINPYKRVRKAREWRTFGGFGRWEHHPGASDRTECEGKSKSYFYHCWVWRETWGSYRKSLQESRKPLLLGGESEGVIVRKLKNLVCLWTLKNVILNIWEWGVNHVLNTRRWTVGIFLLALFFMIWIFRKTKYLECLIKKRTGFLFLIFFKLVFNYDTLNRWTHFQILKI